MKLSSAACLLLLVTSAQAAHAAKWPETRDVTVSEPRTTATGTWNYHLKRSTHAWSCGDAPSSGLCLEHLVTVNNQSGETLLCQLRVDIRRADGTVERSFEGPAVVLPRTWPEVHAAITDDRAQAEIAAFDCLARAPYKRVARTAGCKFDLMGKPFETYYPAEAKLKSLQGPVIVAFRLEQRLGPAVDVAVAESSLVPLLDEAALRFIRDQDFRTNCPGGRYDLLMRFKLRDQVAAQK
jgi:TonB family protein